MSQKLIKNQNYTLTIESLCGNGNGVGRYDGFVIFVPNSAAGDTLEVKIIKITKSYAVGKIEKIIVSSPHRQAGGCPYMAKCGGCSFQHITYEEECVIKKAMINDSLSRIGGINLSVSEFFGAKKQNINRYRNKAIYPVASDKSGKLISGFYAAMTHRIIEHSDCIIGPEIFSHIKDSVLYILTKLSVRAYDEEDKTGIIRSIYMRKNTFGKVLLTLIVNADTLGEKNESEICKYLCEKHPEISGILLNTNKKSGNSLLGDNWRTLWGDSYIYDVLCGKKFRIAPAAFYQVNHDQTEILYEKARELADIKPGDVVFDLYCGTGTIGIILSEKDVKLLGVEITPEAVIDACENAKMNGINAEFMCLDAKEALNSRRLHERNPNIIIIDPPRKGCGSDAVREISSFGAEKIIYISCNPQTLARDLADFEKNDYHAEKAVGVDLFPRTGHVETVCLLSKLKSTQHIEVELDMDELDLTDAEKKATYDEIKAYVLEHTGLKVSSLYIAQVKQKCGIIGRENYNKPKSEDTKQPQCPPEKEKAIMEALKHFGMI